MRGLLTLSVAPAAALTLLPRLPPLPQISKDACGKQLSDAIEAVYEPGVRPITEAEMNKVRGGCEGRLRGDAGWGAPLQHCSRNPLVWRDGRPELPLTLPLSPPSPLTPALLLSHSPLSLLLSHSSPPCSPPFPLQVDQVIKSLGIEMDVVVEVMSDVTRERFRGFVKESQKAKERDRKEAAFHLKQARQQGGGACLGGQQPVHEGQEGRRGSSSARGLTLSRPLTLRSAASCPSSLPLCRVLPLSLPDDPVQRVGGDAAAGKGQGHRGRDEGVCRDHEEGSRGGQEGGWVPASKTQRAPAARPPPRARVLPSRSLSHPSSPRPLSPLLPPDRGGQGQGGGQASRRGGRQHHGGKGAAGGDGQARSKGHPGGGRPFVHVDPSLLVWRGGAGGRGAGR